MTLRVFASLALAASVIWGEQPVHATADYAADSLAVRPAHVGSRLPSAFHIDGNEYVFIRVSINSAADVWMLLDTGTTPSAINLDYAKSLGLKLSAAPRQGAGAGSDPLKIYPTKVAHLQAGAFVRTDVPFVAIDHTIQGPDGKPVAGVLGYSFLRGTVLTLDYVNSEAWIGVGGLKDCACALTFALVNHVPTISIQIAGEAIRTLIDTGGAYDLVLTPDAVRRLGLGATMRAATTTSGFGYRGQQPSRTGQGPPLKVGALIRPFSTVTYIPLSLRVDGALGTHFLKDLQVTIDYPARLIRFEPAR